MKTLIFDGSPHPNGDTAALISALQAALPGESKMIRAYDADMAPCIDCRACWETPACPHQDGMQEIYQLIAESDALVIASPLYFSLLTGPLLSLLSRLQVFYCARRFHKQILTGQPKRGGILLAGGGDGSPDPAIAAARCILRTAGAKEIAPPVLSLATDRVPAAQDAQALSQAGALAEFLAGKS